MTNSKARLAVQKGVTRPIFFSSWPIRLRFSRKAPKIPTLNYYTSLHEPVFNATDFVSLSVNYSLPSSSISVSVASFIYLNTFDLTTSSRRYTMETKAGLNAWREWFRENLERSAKGHSSDRALVLNMMHLEPSQPNQLEKHYIRPPHSFTT